MTRRILVAGTAALAVATGGLAAQAADIRGTVDFEGGAAIPPGQLQIQIEDTGQQKAAPAAQVESNGKAASVEFTLTSPEMKQSGAIEVVAQLQREDGWLLARGSTTYTPGEPMHITLYKVMY